MKLLEKYMFNLSISKLTYYLGENLVDTMVEWLPKDESMLERKRLIGMILSLHGTNMLKDKEFRRDIIACMKEEDILNVRDNSLGRNEQNISELRDLVDIISSKTWGENKVSKSILDILDLDYSILETEQDESETMLKQVSSGERFYELLDYQYYIKQRILNNLNSDTELERMLIHMPTGTGKTKTTMHTLVNYMTFSLNKKGVVIWIAHTNELLQQAYETFENVWTHLGDSSINTYKLWGSNQIENTDDELNGIVFCGLAKLMSISKRNPELLNRLVMDCRVIVFDESHKAAAKETRKTIENFMIKKDGMSDRSLIGLTATPGRTTESSVNNDLLTNMFGGKIIDINTDIINQINMGQLKALNTNSEKNIIKYFQDRRVLSKLKSERLSYQTDFTKKDIDMMNTELNEKGYEDFSKEQLERIGRNKSRNLRIMKRLRFLQQDNIPTIVFACSVEQAKLLSAMLSLEDIPNSLVTGALNPVDRRNAIESFKDIENPTNIIINYEVLTTGFDSTNIKCVFITRPTKSIVLYSQMIGRGLRGPLMGGNEECLLIDVDDNLKSYNIDMAFSHFDDYWKG